MNSPGYEASWDLLRSFVSSKWKKWLLFEIAEGNRHPYKIFYALWFTQSRPLRKRKWNCGWCELARVQGRLYGGLPYVCSNTLCYDDNGKRLRTSSNVSFQCCLALLCFHFYFDHFPSAGPQQNHNLRTQRMVITYYSHRKSHLKVESIQKVNRN